MSKLEDKQLLFLLEQSPDGHFVLADGRFTFLNAAAFEMFGRQHQELATLTVQDVLDASEHERCERNMASRLAGQLTGAVTYLARHKDGSTFPIEVHAALLEREDGGLGLHGVIRNVSARKQIESRLERMERSNQAARLAAGIAHDFNNLLAVVQSNCEIAEREAIAPTVRAALKRITIAVERGEAQVAHIREMGSSSRDTQKSERFHLDTVVHEALELTRPRWRDEAEAQGVRYEIQWEPFDAPVVEGAADEIRAALIALIFNALEAMPQGGELLIEIAEDPSGACRLTVGDRGEGIPFEDMDHVTDPFFTTRSDRQMGLGLHLARSVAERHGGRLEMNSRLGEGAEVTLVLPSSGGVLPKPVMRSGAKSPVVDLRSEPTVEEPMRPRTMGGRRLLLIDDQADLVQVVRAILEGKGYEVDLAMKGAEGVELARAVRYSAVLTDLGMPDLSGWEVAEQVSKAQPKTPIILMTGWAAQLDPDRIFESSVDFLLPKPFRSEELLETVQEALDLREQRGSRRAIGDSPAP